MLLLLGCASSESSELTVLAASSLTEAFGGLELAFEERHPELEVRLSFAGSQTLAMQVRHGLQADVMASADLAPLQALAQEDLVGPLRPFARNRLVLVVAEELPVQDLEDLRAVGSLVVGGPEVPVGVYTSALLDEAQRLYGDAWRADVEALIVSREPNVRLVAAKVELGEADAAFVYATDVRGLEGMRVIPLPMGPTVLYHHAALRTEHPPLATAWLDFVEDEEGQAILLEQGFTGP